MRQHKTILLGLVLTLFAAFPLSVMAGDRVSDRPTDRVTDRQADKPSDVAPTVVDVKPTDVAVTDRPPEHDRPTDKVRPTDKRPVDRCLHLADNPRRCVDDKPDDPVNIRHLIWRLFKAHEWEKLVRLLIRLGLL